MSGRQLHLPFDLPDPVKRLIQGPADRLPENAKMPRPPASARADWSRPRPFNYTDALWEVVRDIVATLEEFRHVDLDRVLLSITQARQATKHGVYASCLPLRFEGGARETTQGGRTYRMPEIRREGREILYILYFMLPRFHAEQDYHEKLATIIHELYHISPLFNGDIRRFSGKNFAHGHSRDVYHAAMRKLADRYLATSPRAEQHEFLREPFPVLLQRPGGLVGYSLTRPRPILVKAPQAES